MPKKRKVTTPIYRDVVATTKATWPKVDPDSKKKPKGKKQR